NLMLQEYVPGDDTTVWMFNGVFNEWSECVAGFTGRKLRQHPAQGGATSLGVCADNTEVARLTINFMWALRYQGVLDIGFRDAARLARVARWRRGRRLVRARRPAAAVERHPPTRRARAAGRGAPAGRAPVAGGPGARARRVAPHRPSARQEPARRGGISDRVAPGAAARQGRHRAVSPRRGAGG